MLEEYCLRTKIPQPLYVAVREKPQILGRPLPGVVFYPWAVSGERHSNIFGNGKYNMATLQTSLTPRGLLRVLSSKFKVTPMNERTMGGKEAAIRVCARDDVGFVPVNYPIISEFAVVSEQARAIIDDIVDSPSNYF
jgi:hypothetical protein